MEIFYNPEEKLMCWSCKHVDLKVNFLPFGGEFYCNDEWIDYCRKCEACGMLVRQKLGFPGQTVKII